MEPNQTVDKEVWKKARERAGFKIHFLIYIIGIALFWITWAFIVYIYNGEYNHKWPVYPMLGWGLIVLLHYHIVYRWKNKLTQKEYDKLINKDNK
ncbi:MAG: 2TM domain-containing protein [Bacteroidales bacterium]|jgi:hypothetical protein